MALNHIHQKNFVHNDIKPENILMGKNGYIKVIDLGMVSYLESGEMERSWCGTTGYIAPEKHERKPYDMVVDMFSLGVTIVFLASGLKLFWSKKYKKAEYKNVEIPFEASLNDNAKDFVLKVRWIIS